MGVLGVRSTHCKGTPPKMGLNCALGDSVGMNLSILEDVTMGTTLVSGEDQILHLEILSVPIFRPLAWLRSGWLDMRKNWGASLGYGALIVALGWTLLVFCAT